MSNILPQENLSNDDLKKHLASQIALEDWTDEWSKCGYPRLLHKDYILHRDAACTRGMEGPNTLRENWTAYSQRVKPILKKLKEDQRKEMEQGVLLQGLKELVTSITEGNKSLLNVKKREHSPIMTSSSPRPAKLTKPAKVPSWTKDMSLETYVKQLTTWQEINEDIPEYAKNHELIEELKKNKEIKGLQKFLADHILPVILTKNDQNVKKVTTLLNERYGRTQTEKVEEAIEDLFKFREDQFEDDDELMLAMSELRKRRVDLEITFDEFHMVWMLQKLKKRRKMENFELQTLREVVKVNGPDVVENFEKKFKEIRVEGKRKSLKDSTTHYTESPPSTYYTEAEQEQIEAMYMGKESESRKRLIIPVPVPHPRMVGQGLFPKQDTLLMILELEGTELDLLVETQSHNTKADHVHHPGINPIPQ